MKTKTTKAHQIKAVFLFKLRADDQLQERRMRRKRRKRRKSKRKKKGRKTTTTSLVTEY